MTIPITGVYNINMDKQTLQIFAERLKKLRLEHNLTQAELAKETGISYKYIKEWEDSLQDTIDNNDS